MAVAAVLAAVFAGFAFRHSKIMRRQASFDAHFAQQLSDFRSCLSDAMERLEKVTYCAVCC